MFREQPRSSRVAARASRVSRAFGDTGHSHTLPVAPFGAVCPSLSSCREARGVRGPGSVCVPVGSPRPLRAVLGSGLMNGSAEGKLGAFGETSRFYLFIFFARKEP